MTATPTHAGRFTFLATKEYFEQLTQDIAATSKGDRILLATMAYDPAVPQIHKLTNELCKAAQRGATVRLSIDAYNFLVSERKIPGPLFYRKTLPNKLPAYLAKLEHALASLRASGVAVTVTNAPGGRWSIPFAGRSHAKVSIINDAIYLGSSNLEKQLLECVTRWHNKQDAEWLYQLFYSRFTEPITQKALGTQDLRHRIAPQEELLFDVGVAGQSLIYQEALAVIDRAEKWLFITCQFFPNSTTAQHLKMAYDRGVTVVPVFNNYKKHKGPHRLLQESVTRRERLRMPQDFFEYQLPVNQTYLHAKVLASEKEAIIGSHNFVTAGVRLGTAEIALHSTDPNFGKAAVRTISNEVEMPEIMQVLED